MNVTSMKLSRKLPLYFTCFCLVLTAALATISVISLRNLSLHQAEAQFRVIAEERKHGLESWLHEIDNDMQVAVASPSTARAIDRFEFALRALGNEAERSLQDAYIHDNPNPFGEKDLLVRPVGEEYSQRYHDIHASFHRGFRTLQQRGGYYDIFLFNTTGDLIYSVFKELDYATNFLNGKYSSTGLGVVFRAALNGHAGEIYLDDFAPYAPSAGAPASFVATQIANADGEVIGVLAFQMPVDRMVAIVGNELGLGESGEVILVADDLTARSTSRHEGRFEILDEIAESEQIISGLEGQSVLFEDVVGQNQKQVLAYSTFIDFHGAHWALVAEIDMDEVLARAHATRNMLIVVSIISVVLLSALGWFIARSITRPISRVVDTIERISDGDYDQDVVDAARGDEIGDIAKALVNFTEKLALADQAEQRRVEQQKERQTVVAALNVGLKNLSKGDLTKTIDEHFEESYKTLRMDFNETVNTLRSALGEVVATAGNIKRDSVEIRNSSMELSNRTESQAATLEETAAALDEMTHGVASAAENAKSVEKIVGEAREQAQESGQVVQDAVLAMTEIEKSSKHISQIVGVIDDIAFQTNLLALNAGVEAARAGDAGKGFAVVASEVRALAQRSSAAAKEIKELISNSSVQVRSGVDLVGKAGDALSTIVERVAHISSLISEIATSANEQSTGLNEINTGVVHLDQVTQQNAAMVDQSTAASQSLNKDAVLLSDLVGRFRIGPDHATSASRAHDETARSSDFDASVVDDYEAMPVAANGGAARPATSETSWKDF